MNKIKVLIIDDSALVRQLLTTILASSPEIEVVGSAADPLIAREKIKQLNPDVLTLDIEMPKMNGLIFLDKLMRLRPMPVVMISTLTEKGADATLRAMALGAVDFISKPKIDITNSLEAYAEEIVAKVILAAKCNAHWLDKQPNVQANLQTNNSMNENLSLPASTKIIAIGASTGGTEALKEVVSQLPATMPAILVSQHLPATFSQSFVRHVNAVTRMQAVIAQDQQPIETGHVYIAPGDRHLEVIKKDAGYQCRLNDSPAVNRHKPSVEMMFESIAHNVGSNAIGVMLTGMGADGARAMKKMKDAGASNIVQDRASSVVWGMPGQAYKLGAADFVLPLDVIARQLMALV